MGNDNSFLSFSQKIDLSGLLIKPIVLIYALLVVCICIILLSMNMLIYALIFAGIIITIVVFAVPEIGLILSLAILTIDLIYNPSEQSGMSWISAGRILAIISLASYLVHKINKPKFQINTTREVFILFALFVISGFIAIPFSSRSDVILINSAKLIINLGVTLAAVDLLSKKILCRQTLFTVIMGSLTGILCIMFGNIAVHFNSHDRLDFLGTGVEPVAISIGIGIISTLILITLNSSKKMIILYILAVLFMFLMLNRTGSRSVILGIPLSILIAGSITYWKKISKFVMIVIVVLMFAGLVYGILRSGFVTGELRDRVTSMYKNDSYKEDVRWKLWSVGLQTYFQHPLGVGPGNESFYFTENARSENLRQGESHNTFLSILIEDGPLGLLLFIACLAVIFKKCISMRNSSYRFSALLILIFCILQITKVTSQTARTFWQPIALVMILIETDWYIYKNSLINHDSESLRRISLK